MQGLIDERDALSVALAAKQQQVAGLVAERDALRAELQAARQDPAQVQAERAFDAMLAAEDTAEIITLREQNAGLQVLLDNARRRLDYWRALSAQTEKPQR